MKLAGTSGPRRLHERSVLGALLLGVTLLAAVGNAQGEPAQGNPTVTLMPSQLHVNPGDLCTLSVMVDDAVDSLGCMEVYIAFDSTLVRCTTAVEGVMFKQASFPRFFRWELVTADTATAVDCVLGYRSYVIAPGELVRFVFRAKQVGICPVYLTGVRLWDIDRIELSPVMGDFSLIIIGTPIGVPPGSQPRKSFFNYPNPFNPLTTLVLDLPSDGDEAPQSSVLIEVYSVSGRRVSSVFGGLLPAGRFEIPWDGRDDSGEFLPAGVYLAVARDSRRVSESRLVIVR
jgi:hypothetical protein